MKAEEIARQMQKKQAKPEVKTKEIRTKTKVAETGNSRSEDKRDTKTKVEESRTQGTALCVGSYVQGPCETGIRGRGGADHRIIVETMEVLKREYEAKSNGCWGGNQK